MIWDSYVWKEELARDLQSLKRRLQRSEPLDSEDAFESMSVAIDKFVLTSALIVRKLSEAQKLSDKLESTILPVRKYLRANAERPIHLWNWHRLDEFYDLETPEQTGIRPRNLCNLLIHSFVYVPEMDETGRRFKAILFNSDRTKDQDVLGIDLETFFRFVDSVCEDYVVDTAWSASEGMIRKSRIEA